MLTSAPQPVVDVPFDAYCLLLPNLFDETISEYRPVDPASYIRLFSKLGVLLDGEGRGACAELRDVLQSSARVVVLMTSNFTEAQRMDRDRELAGYLDVVAGSTAGRDAAVLIKPHPRDSVDKISELRERLQRSFGRVVVLDDPLLFYLTFEVIWAKYFVGQRHGALAHAPDVICFSSACLALEYLYRVRCTIGFGAAHVRRLFHPQWVDLRLRHEADLRLAVEAIRSGRFGQPAAAAVI